MIAVSPEQSLLLQAASALPYAVHVAGGTVALVSGTIAILARKGGFLHRQSGKVFFVSMLVMAAAAVYLGLAIQGQLVNAIIGTMVLYLVYTGWLAVWRPAGNTGGSEKIALAVILCMCVPFAILSVQLATGMAPLFHSKMALKGPVLIAIYVFTMVMVIAAVSDMFVIFAGGISGAPRIARHLWRMGLGLTLATGSAFTNGLPRLIPMGQLGHSDLMVLPQFVPLFLMLFWLIRVRFTRWYGGGPFTEET